MEVLVQISSIRRSLFNEEERSKFITALMKGIREILVSSIGLDDLNNYHEFCRLLSRFRSTYQWSEIAEKTEYSEWIDLVARFSIKGFENWQVLILLTITNSRNKSLKSVNIIILFFIFNLFSWFQ